MRTFFADCTLHKSSIAQIAEFVNKTGGNIQGKRILKTFKINTKQSIVFKNLKKH